VDEPSERREEVGAAEPPPAPAPFDFLDEVGDGEAVGAGLRF
jgi:hypothetical protein